MRCLIKLTTLNLLFAGFVFCSCKKDKNCEDCNNGNKPPVANAGPNQVITLPTDSTLLDGSASSDPDGVIKEWHWQQVAGPASSTILWADAPKISIKNLISGVYRFELMVTDNGGLSAKDTIQVMVNGPANRPPIANAGNDTTITLPVNTVILDGSKSTDPDKNVSNYQWKKIAGPASFNIINANSAQSPVTNLAEGVYQFELTVMDSLGLVDRDTTSVTVIKLYTNEIIFKDQVWRFDYTSLIIIPNIYSHLPVGVSFKVFIKRDNTNTWLEVAGSFEFESFTLNTDLIIMSLTGSIETDTPDIKIVY